MVIGLTWIESDYRAISNEQLIAYQDDEGNVTALPPVQFVVTSEPSDFDWYPVIYFFIGGEDVMWRTFRTQPTKDMAFEFAKSQVENALCGTFEDGNIQHWLLNEWAFSLAKSLGKL